jgi:hypothetical protein
MKPSPEIPVRRSSHALELVGAPCMTRNERLPSNEIVRLAESKTDIHSTLSSDLMIEVALRLIKQ